MIPQTSKQTKICRGRRPRRPETTALGQFHVDREAPPLSVGRWLAAAEAIDFGQFSVDRETTTFNRRGDLCRP